MQNYDIYTITGEEEFVDGEQSLGVNMIDFWRFQFSNIYDFHGELAEYIVAVALGKSKPDNKTISLSKLQKLNIPAIEFKNLWEKIELVSDEISDYVQSMGKHS